MDLKTSVRPRRWLHHTDRAVWVVLMDQVCRLLGYVPNAHRDLASINDIVTKNPWLLKPGIGFHTVPCCVPTGLRART